MALSDKDREHILSLIKIIDLAIDEIRDKLGIDWVTVASTSDGYMKVNMFDYDGVTGTTTSTLVASRRKTGYKLLLELEEEEKR